MFELTDLFVLKNNRDNGVYSIYKSEYHTGTGVILYSLRNIRKSYDVIYRLSEDTLKELYEKI